VRRSSDNAEQDIGFSASMPFGALDTSALAAFVGSGSAFVTKFYDQTGNGWDAVQATSSKQPRIVNAGVYDGNLVFDGIDDAMVVTGLPELTPYTGLYTKIKQANATTFKIILETGPDGQTTAGAFALYVFTSNADWVMAMGNASGGRATRFPMTSQTALTQITALYDRNETGTNETKLYRGGSALNPTANANNEQSGNFAPLDLYIGGRTASSLFADMWEETLALYDADTSGIRLSIEALIA